MTDDIAGICIKCGKPIYHDNKKVKSIRDGAMFHGDCFFEVFKPENVEVKEDEQGDAYYQITMKGD